MLFFILAVILFILADILIRWIIRRATAKKMQKEREKALEVNLQLDFSHEAKSLKRIEVDNPKAKILAVDDEEVILDSFRKILVIDGYSIDTVETGQEALGLIQKHHYDFVFTDLKMPEMDGVEVCKSVKHMRPDIDVIIITGYASVETAVETMKHGAMDYVQKPFSEDELLDFANKMLIRRKDRIDRQLVPKVHITHVADADIPENVEFAIPGGVFISRGHCWASLNPDGIVSIGLDDFAKKLIGKIDAIEFPNLGMEIVKGQCLFNIKQGTHSFPFNSPLSGKVESINSVLGEDPQKLEFGSYGKNWICTLNASQLDAELKELNVGEGAVSLFDKDIKKVQEFIRKSVFDTKDEKLVPADGHLYRGEMEQLKDKELNIIIEEFFSS